MQHRQIKSAWLWNWQGRPRALAIILLVFLGDVISVSASFSLRNDGSLNMKERRGKSLHLGRNVPETPRISLLTPYGPIRISLLSQNAPLTVNELIKESKKREKTCVGCEFYRAEARATVGPPYGLLQGSLGKGITLPKDKEGSKTIQAGDVVMLPSSNDFYIALQDHPNWSSAHTVVGTVDDFVTPDLICIQPTYKKIHEKFSTEMQMLKEPVDFVLTDDMAEMIMPKFSHNAYLRTTATETNEDYEYEYVDEDEIEKGLHPVEKNARASRKQGAKSKNIRAPATNRNRKTDDLGLLARDSVNDETHKYNDRWDTFEEQKEDSEGIAEQGTREPLPRNKRPAFAKSIRITALEDQDINRPPDIRARSKRRADYWDLPARKDENFYQQEGGDDPEKVF